MIRQFVFIVTAMLGAPALAGPPTDDVKKEILRLMDLQDYGTDVEGTRWFELTNGQVLALPFLADATVEYYVTAGCDDDCLNLDLALLEADGTEADLDDADDKYPVLNIHASEYKSVLDKPKGIPRPMTLEVRMKDCQSAVCTVAVRIEQVE